MIPWNLFIVVILLLFGFGAGLWAGLFFSLERQVRRSTQPTNEIADQLEGWARDLRAGIPVEAVSFREDDEGVLHSEHCVIEPMVPRIAPQDITLWEGPSRG